MTEPEIIEIVRAVPIDTLTAMTEIPDELVAQLQTMMQMGATVVDIASVLVDGGYRIVIIPEESEEPESEMEPGMEPQESYEEDDYEEEPNGLMGLLDRLRSVFGKSVSFESENASIARNRKRASARQPHDFQRAIWSTRKGIIRCRVCGGGQPADGEMCVGVTMKDSHYEMEMPDPEMAVGELTLRSATMAQAYDLIEEALGCWPQHDAHYMDENPFVDEGIACVNCVAYCPEIHGCYWVEGSINPSGLCKLWVIPEILRKAAPVMKEIVERDGEFCVTSADGETEFGCYPDRASAEDRLAQVERFSKASFAPPKGVIDEAKRALAWMAEGEAGAGFTDVGRARASQLAAGKAVSLETIKRMSSYLARHVSDKEGEGWSPGEKGYPSPGRVAWAAWGGDPAISWTAGIIDSMDKAQPDMSSVHVETPMGSGRNKKNPEPVIYSIPGVFSKADERRFTLGPWYVPDSYDAHGEWTDPEELQLALWDYVRSSDRTIRLQHNTDVVAGEWVEALSWPYAVSVPMLDVETETVNDHEFPPGTVFMGVIWEPYAWEMVKAGKIRGYSMGGNGQRVTVDLPSEGML